jgi:hypothetical protein
MGAGPVDFGMAEFQAASAARNRKLFIKTELSLDPPETFRIEPYTAGGAHITGGDLRGLMYGLIEASEQMRSIGRLKAAHGAPATPLRAIRFVLEPSDLNQPWFGSDLYWRAYFQILARSRINRFTLAMPRLPAPPTHVRFLSQLATEYGIDFVLGLPDLPGDPPTQRGLLTSLLAACPLIRGIEIEPGKAVPAPSHDAILRAIEGAGRRVTLDVRGGDVRGGDPHDAGLTQGALDADLPVRVSSASGCAELSGTPENFCFWSLHEDSVATADSLRDRVPELNAAGSMGFELDAPRVEGDQPALFYWVWGRVTYDPKAPASPPVMPPPSSRPPGPAPSPAPVSPAGARKPDAPNSAPHK